MTAVPLTGKLVLTIGLPGSGKSTWAQEQSQRWHAGVILDQGLWIIERDSVREELTGSQRDHSQEAEVTRIARTRAADGLRRGYTVIIADTNLKPRYRNEWMGLAGELGASVQIESFLAVPLGTCIERDSLRPDPVGEDVIRRMHQYLLDSGQLGPLGSMV
jgi:predicted kinase